VVEKSGDLPRIVGGIKPGSKATLQVFRRGSTRDLSVTVAEFEADRPVRRGRPSRAQRAAPAAKSALGLTVADLTDAQKKELRVRGGVRVEAVEGAAARAGLREGDVILSLDNTEIADAKQFAAVSAKVEKARAVSVLVRRGDWVNYLVIRPGADGPKGPFVRPGLRPGEGMMTNNPAVACGADQVRPSSLCSLHGADDRLPGPRCVRIATSRG
jgi:serine protease Do